MNQSSVAAKRRILVVDDHPIVRQGLALLINRESDLMVCGEAEDAPKAMQAIATAKPDILLVDISLNGPDGLDLLKDVRIHHPELPVLILSMHDESIYAERALRAGAQGYIMKQEATEKVLVALRRILSDEIYVSERIANRMLQHYIGNRGEGRASSVADLTDRELEVFRLIGEGHSDPANCRGTAHQREDRRILPGAHQGKIVITKRPRTRAARHSVEHQRKSCVSPIRTLNFLGLIPIGKSLTDPYTEGLEQKKVAPACRR